MQADPFVHAAPPTEAPPELAAVARAAAQALNTPVAVVALLTAEQLRFLAAVGMTVPGLARDDTLCDRMAPASGEPGQTPDLGALPALAGHPLVAGEPGLRSHLGAPLLDDAGGLRGTLSVFDVQTRVFTPDEQARLKDLALLAACALRSQEQALQLSHMAMTDTLTGLGNRADFDRALEGELAHAMRTGEPFSVLMLNLDGFKQVNDGFGHAAGDEVLRAVAQRLLQQVRTGDAVCRFGSDAFGIVMRHGAMESAEALGQRIRRAVAAPIRLSGGDDIGVGVSIGAAAYDDDVLSGSQLLAAAHDALRLCKRHNEHRWKVFMGVR